MRGSPLLPVSVLESVAPTLRTVAHPVRLQILATGMMTAIEYLGDADGDGVLTRSDYEPMLPLPVVTISDQPSAFAPGASGAVRVQWTPGQAFGLFIGPNELALWVSLPGLGTLVLDPTSAALYGLVLTSTSGVATLPYILPNNPAIIGLRVGMQGVGVVPPANSVVLSTFQALTAR